jgi:transposase
MVKVPTPEEEDHRRLCRERKLLTAERIRHVNRMKGLLFSQGIGGYEPLHRDRWEMLEALQTGDGRQLPGHLKGQLSRELDRIELLMKQIKAVEIERDALLATQNAAEAAPASSPRYRRHRAGGRCYALLGGVFRVGPRSISALAKAS